MVFPILGIYPRSGNRWTIGSDTAKKLEKDDDVFVKNNTVYRNIYKDEESQETHFPLWINFSDNVGTSESGKAIVLDLFKQEHGFETIEPIELIEKLLFHFTDNDSLILDFFAGSATTAHAVMNINEKEKSNRRYICIQLPEEGKPDDPKTKDAYEPCRSLNVPANIAEIAKERIRRAGKQVSDGLKDGQSVDTGFKVFKLSESSFKQWRQPENGADLEQQLRLAIDSVAEHAALENMLYELMLRLGCKLTSPVKHKNGVYWVTDEDTGKRIALLLESANQTLIDDVIAAAPAKVVTLDKWFDGNDALKSNTVLQMKDAGIVFECV